MSFLSTAIKRILSILPAGDVTGLVTTNTTQTVTGAKTFSGDVTFTGGANAVTVGTPTTADATADTILAASDTTQTPLVIQGIASQAVNLFECQNSAGTVLTRAQSGGTLNAPGYLVGQGAGSVAIGNYGNQISLGATEPLAWTNTALDASATLDTGLARVAANVAKATDGSTGLGWLQHAGLSRVNADVDNASVNVMANITGLSATLLAGRKYTGKLVLYCKNTVAVEGFKCDFDGGAATMTSFRAHGTVFDTALLLSAQTSALATDFTVVTITGDSIAEIHFAFVCNAAGTFIPRAAPVARVTGQTTVYANSYMWLEDTP